LPVFYLYSMAKDSKRSTTVVLERELRYLRRCVRRLEIVDQIATKAVKASGHCNNFSSLEERLVAHHEAAKEFARRLRLAEEIFGKDSPQSP
jgi:hypothetical protein